MPCSFEHRVMAAVCVGGAAAADWKEDDHWAKHPLLAAATAAGCGTLPDVLEPALHPNHRQFFHSFLLATGVGFGLYKLYQWEPESEGGEARARRGTYRWLRISGPFGDGRVHAEVSATGRQALMAQPISLATPESAPRPSRRHRFLHQPHVFEILMVNPDPYCHAGCVSLHNSRTCGLATPRKALRVRA